MKFIMNVTKIETSKRFDDREISTRVELHGTSISDHNIFAILSIYSTDKTEQTLFNHTQKFSIDLDMVE